MIAAILAFFAALFVIVLVHEIGHLVAARRAGMEASVFSVGFGPRLFGVRCRGTDFRVSAIPLGGYVRIDAMEEAVESPPGSGTRFDQYPFGARALVISAGVIMNLLLAVVIYVALPMTRGVVEIPPLRIASADRIALPLGTDAWGRLPADARVLALDGRPLDTPQDLYMAVAGHTPGTAVLMLAGGREVALPMPADDDDRLALLEALEIADPPVVGGVERGSPAHRAGFESGDRIVAVDGAPVASWQTWVARLNGAGEGPVRVRVHREGAEVALTLQPAAAAAAPAAGTIRGVLRRRVGPVEAVQLGAAHFGETLDLIRESWWILLRGRVSVSQVSGPVAVVSTTVRVFQTGWEPFLRFVAFLSVNIAVVNFLPIPGLDGGYAAFLGLEAVRRRPLPARVQAYLGRVGVIWLMLIMAGTVVNDLARTLAGD